jgi:hypothetical protein
MTAKWAVTFAPANDGVRLPELLDRANTAGDVWPTDTTCRLEKNAALPQ